MIAATAHKIEGGKYLYRGFVITRIDEGNGVWWHFEDGPVRGADSLAGACRAIDGDYDAGFIYAAEGPMAERVVDIESWFYGA